MGLSVKSKGVLHKNGFMYATNKYISIKIKIDYNSAYENKVIDKKGNIIDGTDYPDSDYIFNTCYFFEDEIPYEKFNNVLTEYKKRHKLDNTSIYYCNIHNHSYHTVDGLLKFVNVCKLRNMKIYCSTSNYGYKMLVGKNDDGEYIMLQNVKYKNDGTYLYHID